MIRKVKYIAIIFIISIGLIILPKVKILFEGERGRIKRIIYAAKKATEREDLFKCLSFVSIDYSDRYGNNYRSLMLIGQRVFDIYDNIAIGIRQLSISLDSDTATAEVESTAVAKNVEDKEINIFETETIKFLIYFKKEQKHWKVIELDFLEPRDPLYIMGKLNLFRKGEING
jgi:hypothetical protein